MHACATTVEMAVKDLENGRDVNVNQPQNVSVYLKAGFDSQQVLDAVAEAELSGRRKGIAKPSDIKRERERL